MKTVEIKGKAFRNELASYFMDQAALEQMEQMLKIIFFST
jgi:hypothetical protein